MKLTRIAALGAVMLGLLAVPATAMASTGSQPQAAAHLLTAISPKVRCPPPPKAASAATEAVPVGSGPGIRVICCVPVPRRLAGSASGPVRAHCSVQPLVFDMPAWSSTGTEVHGPRLTRHELVFYRGGVYVVAAVAGDKFTLDLRGTRFVNRGPAIHDGRAVVLHGVVVVVGTGPGCPK